MRKRILSTLLTLVLLAALVMPTTVSGAASASFENGVYGASVGKGVWLLDLKKVSGNNIQIGIAWSDDSTAFGTVKPFKKKIKKTIKFSVTGNYLNPDKTVSDETTTISGTIKLKGKKLKCNINGESFTAKYAP